MLYIAFKRVKKIGAARSVVDTPDTFLTIFLSATVIFLQNLETIQTQTFYNNRIDL